MLRRFLLLTLIILSIGNIFANHHNYADLEIDIFEDGTTSISGITNYKGLQNISNSPIYTSKKGEFWLFNLTTNEVFDDFIFKLNLPDGVEINYIKTTPQFRIEDTGTSLSIIGLGEKQELNILVQYKINKKYSFLTHEQIIAFLSGFLIFTLVFGSIFLIKIYFGPKKIKYISQESPQVLENQINLDLLPQRQKEIIEILEKRDKISQKELVEIMQIPKSSVSRNVNSLIARKILDSEKSGVTTFIFLRK